VCGSGIAINFVGGIAGSNTGAKIAICEVAATVIVRSTVAGLVAYNQDNFCLYRLYRF